ncbi:hypothetical protein [Polaribacter cellanae]|uniref:Uncharacterized protein n=1 Tax=Polaribacter cellanae TaxID=2818493 RepID=A0A975H9U4_9FLAO|nr:hypothetical protein [Polaribacter cellanae]QTE23355.1 hypothetical protein J3359_03495 [Polaribacter cellanae]
MENFQEIIGKALDGLDNDTHMYPNRDFPNKCIQCSTPLNKGINPQYKLKKKQYDLSHTYDGYTIVSERFKQFCLKNNFKGLVFSPLPNDKNFYVFRSNNIFEIDPIRRKVKFDRYCDKCKRFTSVAGGTPAFSKYSDKKLKNTIYRSDIEFGGIYELSPFLIISLEVFELIRKEKFKGIYFGKNSIIYL